MALKTGKNIDVYNIDDFPYNELESCDYALNDKGKKSKYANIHGAFDIETTTMLESEYPKLNGDFGFMYIWQCCIDGIVCIGRTWEEYTAFIDNVKCAINTNGEKTLVIYVHFLSFEFQFMRDFMKKVTKVFATEKRSVVKCRMDDVEYRCSYRLTNMSLDKFLKKTKGVTVFKESGKEFDYKKKRYPDTELNDSELLYCVADVLGLWQAINTKLEEYSIADIPLTSTGYVRNDYRNACLTDKSYIKQFKRKELNERTYTLCKEASRGAIAGSNHIYTDEILSDVDSEDIKSSYPFNMCTDYFPASPFVEHSCKFPDDTVMKLLKTKCCIITFCCSELVLKKWQSIPYISKAKCRAIEDAKCGNGKVYMAKRVCMTCTEIDYHIIMNDYYCKDIIILELWYAERDLLHPAFRKHLLEMFQIKTDLENGDPYDYMKYKNKINSSFGMMLTDILHPEILYEGKDNPWMERPLKDLGNALKQYYQNKKSFLNYQDGIWVLAHGRKNLHEGMEVVGNDIVQVDTDSVKHINDYREGFNKINERIIANASKYDIPPYATKSDGSKVYLGIWEHEGDDNKTTYKEFKTLGSKKYCVKTWDDEIIPTVSGLSKNCGNYIKEHGGLNFFKIGTHFTSDVSGRTSALYRDFSEIHTINIDGHEVTLGSNIAVRDVEYTLGVTSEWFGMILESDFASNEIDTSSGAFKGWT